MSATEQVHGGMVVFLKPNKSVWERGKRQKPNMVQLERVGNALRTQEKQIQNSPATEMGTTARFKKKKMAACPDSGYG